MADTINFNDGTREVVFRSDRDGRIEALERILRERLGNDTAAMFKEILCDFQELKDLEDECATLESYNEDYHEALTKALRVLAPIEDKPTSPDTTPCIKQALDAI